jgi:hypothetical protein
MAILFCNLIFFTKSHLYELHWISFLLQGGKNSPPCHHQNENKNKNAGCNCDCKNAI